MSGDHHHSIDINGKTKHSYFLITKEPKKDHLNRLNNFNRNGDNKSIITETEDDENLNEFIGEFEPNKNETSHSDTNPSSIKKEKKYKCTYPNCTKVYRSKENLKLHYQNIHNKIKPYQCSYCPLKFSHRNGRIYHERKVHTAFFPYKCIYVGCGHSFPCKSAMDVHIKTYHPNSKKVLFNVV